MSIQIMTAVWQHGPQDRNECTLLLAIADNANERGEAFPSIAVLGQKARMSKSLVLRTLRRLTDQGWLAVRSREAAPESYGRARGNLYVITLAKLRLASRGVSLTPRERVSSATTANSATSDAENPRSVSLTPRQKTARDEVSNAADEVSSEARRGVKPGVALIVEPSGTITRTNPPTPQRGALDPDDEEAALRQQVLHLSRKSPEYFRAARRLIELRRMREGPSPPVEMPMGFPHGRRRRRLTEAQMMARVGGAHV